MRHDVVMTHDAVRTKVERAQAARVLTQTQTRTERLKVWLRRPGVRPALVVGVVVVGFVAWLVAIQVLLGSVRIAYDAEPVRCDGAEVGLYPGYDEDDPGQSLYFDEQFHDPLVELSPGGVCGIRMHVVNDGWADVVVEKVGMPMMDQTLSGPLDAVMVNPNGQTRLPDTENSAAEFLLEGPIVVPAGATQSFVVVVEDSGDYAALGECTFVRTPGPYAVLTAATFTRQVDSAPTDGFWYFRSGDEECSR